MSQRCKKGRREKGWIKQLSQGGHRKKRKKGRRKESKRNTVVSKIASLFPKGKPQGWKIPSSLTGVS